MLSGSSHNASNSNSMDSSKPAPAASKRMRGMAAEAEEAHTPGAGPQSQQPQAEAAPVYDPDMYTRTGKLKATGRTCVECGATSTPQWREGPKGACGQRSAAYWMGCSSARGALPTSSHRTRPVPQRRNRAAAAAVEVLHLCSE